MHEVLVANSHTFGGSLSAMNLSLALASATKIAASLGCATATLKAWLSYACADATSLVLLLVQIRR